MTKEEYAKGFADRIEQANKARAAAMALMGQGSVSPDAAAIAFSNMYLAEVVGLVVCELAHHRLKDQDE